MQHHKTSSPFTTAILMLVLFIGVASAYYYTKQRPTSRPDSVGDVSLLNQTAVQKQSSSLEIAKVDSKTTNELFFLLSREQTIKNPMTNTEITRIGAIIDQVVAPGKTYTITILGSNQKLTINIKKDTFVGKINYNYNNKNELIAPSFSAVSNEEILKLGVGSRILIDYVKTVSSNKQTVLNPVSFILM